VVKELKVALGDKVSQGSVIAVLEAPRPPAAAGPSPRLSAGSTT
jgi:pyruvate/2-oxoglutarate dehydrogenase complex dihydrolipoamide acyltransferase (E2) component